MTSLRGLRRRIGNHVDLLWRDPERFARNLTQFTHPALFERRLIDVLHSTPLHVEFEPNSLNTLRLNVLDGSWSPTGMTGGPNTVVNLACRIARCGIPVRFVSTAAPVEIGPAWFRRHAESLLKDPNVPEIAFVSAADPAQPVPVGPQDVFLATHWRTAQQLKPILTRMPIKQFFYMLQEFEPAFHAWSSNFALAVETLGFDYWPIINESALADYMLSQPFGRLKDPVTRERAMIFEPAVDLAFFHPPTLAQSSPKRRLLFYARPQNLRNMFGVGLLALREAVRDPIFTDWEFMSIGGRDGVPDLDLGNGHMLRSAPWVPYTEYADVLRGADILLCPMLSPHTSYPVLEMAACGGLSVTNTFATKTQATLARLSENIVAVEPVIEAFAEGLIHAAHQVAAGRERSASLNMSQDWAEVLEPVARRMATVSRAMAGAAR